MPDGWASRCRAAAPVVRNRLPLLPLLSALRRLLLLLLIPLPAALIGLQDPSPMLRGVRVVDVVAAVPETGGFQPDSVTVYAGQKLRLRFHAADTAHGVAIGPGLGIDLGDLLPGEVKVVDVTFPDAGTFTFYCNKWCSPNHWRMRGVIQVQGREQEAPQPAVDPVIEHLAAEGIDIDAYLTADHTTNHAAAPAEPSSAAASAWNAAAGAAALAGLAVPDELRDEQWRRVHTPLEGEALLAKANPQADRALLGNVTAYLWLGSMGDTSENRHRVSGRNSVSSASAATLYAKNCAACHGAAGDGRGFDAASAPVAPPAFDAGRMAARRSDVLYAKIRRGGMGTGMPNFGTLFSPEETWSLVDYLWLLAFGE